MDWLGQQANKVGSAISNIGKPPQPFVEPDFQNMTKEQQDRWAAAQESANKGVLSNVSDTLGKFKFWGGRRPKKPTKKKKPKKQTKNKRK